MATLTTRQRLRRAAPWAAAVGLVLILLLAYLGKAVCVGGRPLWWDLTAYCYSDIYALWSRRGFDVGAVPYAGVPAGYVEDYTIEYPPGMVFPAWIIGLLTDSRRAFFDVHAVTFAISAAVALWRCDRALEADRGARWRRSRVRLLGFALSPGIVLFGMQNWDLWPVAIVALGLAAAARGRTTAAAVWFGLAAGVKWWPALLVPLLMVGPWAPARPAGDDERGASWRLPDALLGADLRPALVAGGVWLAVQLPALVVSPSGWWEAIRFHLRRGANLDSTAAAIQAFGERTIGGAFWGGPFSTLWTVGSLTLLVAGVAYAMVRLRAGTLHPGNAALAVVALFLLTGKVFSPQFIVWLLPVAVVATVSWTPILATEATNAAVWLLYGPWLGRGTGPAFDGFLRASQGMSVVRTLTTAWIVAAALLPSDPETVVEEDEEDARAAEAGAPPARQHRGGGPRPVGSAG